MVEKGDYQQLTRIAEWVGQGKLKPIVDKVYSFADYEQALLRISAPGKRARIVMQIEG